MKIEELIAEMQAAKQEYSTLSIDQVLQLFEIQALIKLTTEIKRTNG